MLLMPLTDAGYFRNNFTIMHQYALAHGVALQPVLFPKWKYGAEWCYLYRTPPPNDPNVANNCQLDSSTGQTLAFENLVSVMDFSQGLVGCTNPGTPPTPGFAVWYGWSTSEFPEQTAQSQPGEILENFWQSLPTGGTLSGCNLQAAYITWLDTGYTNNPDVQALQLYVKNHGGLQWVNTELYSDSQIVAGYNLYTPYQTVITGYWNAPDITS
jgi:hypothetical protein